MRRAAIFDLDRTLVNANTVSLYSKWLRRNHYTTRADTVRSLLLLARNLVGAVNIQALTATLVLPLKGVEETRVAQGIREWIESELIQHVSDAARAAVAARKEQGFVCAILTGSTNYAAAPFAESVGIEHVVSTRFEVANGVFTGALDGPLCYGQGKVFHATQWAKQHDIALQESVFYTDSISDLPMLECVGERVIVNPDFKLRRMAGQRGWPQERWT